MACGGRISVVKLCRYYYALYVRMVSWSEIKRRALSLPVDKTDEHVFKLIQVCEEHKERSAFPGMDAICKRAAITVMSKPFF